MKRIIGALLPALLLSSTLAQASSEEAWQKSRQVMVQACINASHLSKVKVLGEAIEYDDNTGYSALLLEGRYPQPQMKISVDGSCACFSAAADEPASAKRINCAG